MVGGGVVFRRSKSASRRHNQLKHKDRHAILSSPPSRDTPATPADASRPLVVPYSTILYSLLRAYATSLLPCYSLLY